MNHPEYYEKLTEHVVDHLIKLLGDGFRISYTGTIDPRFYEGHMNFAELAGLKIYISQRGHKCDPTMEQIENYYGKFKK